MLLVARAFGFTILWTVAFYIFLTYMPTFTKTYVHLSESKALWSNSVGLIAVVLAIPLVGHLSDRVGRKPLLLAGGLCFFILPYPIFSMLLSGASLAEIMAAQIIFGVVLSLFCGVGPSAISEIFPTHNRSTLMSTGYAISVAIFGGLRSFHCNLADLGDWNTYSASLLRDGRGGRQRHRHMADARDGE